MSATTGVRETALAWAQQWPWNEELRPFSERSPSLYLWARLDVGGAIGTAADLRRSVGVVCARHPSLRTTFRTDDDGRVRQVEWPVGEERYRVVERDLDDPTSAGASSADLDLHDTWPFVLERGTTASGRGTVTLFAHHVAADGEGFRIFVHELEAVHRGLLRGEPVTLDEPGLGSPDVAALESSEEGRRLHARAVRHWLGRSDEMAGWSEVLQGRRDVPPLRMHVARGTWRGSSAALRALAARARASVAAVATALVAEALAEHFARERVLMHMLVSNRHIPAYRNGVSAVAQAGLLSVARGEDLAGTIGSASRGAMAAMRHARYDASELHRVGGPAFASGVPLPSVNMVVGPPPDVDPAAQRRETPGGSVLESWVVPRPSPGLNFHVFAEPGTLSVELRAGAHLVDGDEALALVASVLDRIP